MDRRIKQISVGLFFLSLLVVGISIYRDFGISWDEPTQRLIGQATIKHLAEIFVPSSLTEENKRNVPDFDKLPDKDYGVAFEAPAVALEVMLKISDKRDVYMFRHLLTFFVFFAGVYAVYRMATRRFEDWRIGILAALFLVFTPRFFAEGFYNCKDVVFMAVFAIAMYTSISFILTPNFQTAIINSLATAIAIDVRIMATMLILGSVLILFIRLVKKELPISKTCLALATYLLATMVFVVVMWPWLWADPLTNFIQAFKNMSKFRWDYEVLYMGNFIRATQLPWHYSLVWISITIPVLFLALFVIGAFAIFRQMFARGFRFWEGNFELQDIIFLSIFLAPIIAVILLRSVLYDGWRQLYFVYPSFLLISMKGWTFLWNSQQIKKCYKVALAAFTSIYIMYIGAWMWNAHPMQNVYFNIFAGSNIKERYEMDYWGLANRMALEYILEHDKSPVITVWKGSHTALDKSILMVTSKDRARIRYANDKRQPFYVFNNYRWVRDKDDTRYGQEYDLYYRLIIDEEIILSVFKLKDMKTALSMNHDAGLSGDTQNE